MKSQTIFRNSILVSVLLAVVVCLVVGGLVSWGLLDSVELLGYDLLVSTRGTEPPPDEIVIVDFDDATMESLQRFPIPRNLLAEVLEKISAGEPSLIGLDILLSEKRDAADDQKLATALAKAGNVILANNFGSEHLPPSEPLPEFRERALDVAFVNMPVDADGLIRRMLLWMRTPDYQGLSFPVAIASNYLGQPLQPGREGTYRIGANEIALDGAGPNSALIDFSVSTALRAVSAQRLLDSDLGPEAFKGKIVLVGQSSAKGKDLYATPVFRFRRPTEGRLLLSGTEIHAAALATMLAGKPIRVLENRSLWLFNFLLIWLVVALVITVRPVFSVPAFIVGILGTFLVAHTLFSSHALWMKFISTETGILLAFPAGLGYRFLEERRQKSHAEAERRDLMGLFERYVSPEVAAEIWERRREIVLAGQEKTATVLFSDIRNFTTLTSGKPSSEVLCWLNDYFTAMSEVIKQNGGFLNKFIGDGMLVVFGVPLSDGVEQDARRAVQAAIEMLERVEELNGQQGAGRPRIDIGVGIHTGQLTAGNVGAHDRLEYSVIGETVNLASRLETLTKEFRVPIVISPQTCALVKSGYDVRPLGETMVRGFGEKVQVYTVGKTRPQKGQS